MPHNLSDHIDALRAAYKRKDIVLYLGAGVSIPNGLPSWDKLVLSMYFSSNEEIFSNAYIRPFPNYLFAISEWIMKEKNEPLDILIRKLKRDVSEDNFMKLLVQTLYAGYFENGGDNIYMRPDEVLYANPTLAEILKFCGHESKGAKAIITYNYDNLLEMGLNATLGGEDAYKAVFRSDAAIEDGQLPIYHVHGYIPVPNTDNNGSKYEEIILSEESYHRAAQDAYYWGNMVQMQHLSNSTGIMIGMSLSDRNIRRILDSLKAAPIKTKNYLLAQRPKPKQLEDTDLNFIRERAQGYMEKFEKSGQKTASAKGDEVIQRITDMITKNESENFEQEFSDLGLHLIWFDEFNEIPEILLQITSE